MKGSWPTTHPNVFHHPVDVLRLPYEERQQLHRQECHGPVDNVVPPHMSSLDILRCSLCLHRIHNSPKNYWGKDLNKLEVEPCKLKVDFHRCLEDTFKAVVEFCIWRTMRKEDLHTGWRRRTEQDEEGPQIPGQMHVSILMTEMTRRRNVRKRI